MQEPIIEINCHFDMTCHPNPLGVGAPCHFDRLSNVNKGVMARHVRCVKTVPPPVYPDGGMRPPRIARDVAASRDTSRGAGSRIALATLDSSQYQAAFQLRLFFHNLYWLGNSRDYCAPSSGMLF